MDALHNRVTVTALLRAGILAGGVAVVGLAPHAASADVGSGNPVAIGFGSHPRLLATLYATTGSEERSYAFTAKGYFKVAGKTVARLPAFSGRASSTGVSHIKLTVSRATRHTIRAAADRHRSHRTILTITLKATDLSGQTPPADYTQDTVLTISRD